MLRSWSFSVTAIVDTIELHAKPSVLSPPHHGTIAGVIRRHVKDEAIGNYHAGVHLQFRTVKVLISDGAADPRVIGNDGRILQNDSTCV
jgi:hypothetical protein